MSNLPIIIGGVALGYFLLNQKKTKTISGGTSKPVTDKPTTKPNKPSNKSDEIVRTDFPGYSIKDNKIIVTSESDAYKFAYDQGVKSIQDYYETKRPELNIVFEKLFGLKTYVTVKRPYNYYSDIVGKFIKLYKSNPQFIYNMWLNFVAGNIDAGGSANSILQFIDLLQKENIIIQNPIQMDLDPITKQDRIIFIQPYKTGVGEETLSFINYPGYFIQDELLTITDGKMAKNYAIMVGKYQPYSNLFRYLFGQSNLQYTDAYTEPYSDATTLIVKEQINSDAVWILLSYLLAGAYSSDKNNDIMTTDYGNILINFANFNKAHFGRDYPTFKSVNEVKLYFEEVIKSMG